MLSESVKRELKAELDRLSGMRQRLERKISAIRALLDEDESDPSRLCSTGQSTAVNGMPFVARVREALRSFNRPATAKEIAEVLEASGMKPTGKTPLQTLVSSELWRMNERGRDGVTKVGHGKYIVQNGETPEVTGE